MKRSHWHLLHLSIGTVLLLSCAIFFLSAKRANPHTSVSGWEYDASCCSGQDCAVAPAGSITATAEGWLIEVQPGQHPAVTSGPWSQLVPYTSDRIRPSGDADFHVCIGIKTQTMFCLYVPEGEWGA